MTQPLRLLVIEDSEIDYQVLVATLGREGFDVHALRVELPETMLAALQSETWDAVITDHHMPVFDAFEAIQILKEHAPSTPALVVSGEPAEALAVRALEAGAEDWVNKGSLKRVAATLRRALRAADCRRRLAAAEAELARLQGAA